MTNSKIRICYTVDSLYAGGAERYVALLAGGLDRSEFDATVIAKNGPGLDAWCGQVGAAGTPVTRLRMDMPFRPFHAIGVYRSFLERTPDIVHVNIPGPYDGQMGLLAPIARLAGARRIVVTEHLPRVERLWKRALVKKLAYRYVDRVITICQANAEPLINRQGVGSGVIDVVYNGIPASYGHGRDKWRQAGRGELELDEVTVGIVYVGSLISRKGIGTLIDALAGLPHRDAVPWRLFGIGEGEERDALAARAASKGIGDRVEFLGARSESEVERLLCASDLLVVPSFMEGMPYVILEAMACSLPVVASRVDGIPEAVIEGETALLTAPGDVEGLSSAINRFLEAPELRRRVGEAGRQRFERLFTLDRHVACMERLYRTLLVGRGSGGRQRLDGVTR
ncbi:MAG: glycosyltransferase family 4 protein [Candidatus Latescibacterota bacterium]|nr:MAG: glycosyltransferase family 4 protein [Candidatus Latescibacterota bacterium]